MGLPYFILKYFLDCAISYGWNYSASLPLGMGSLPKSVVLDSD